MSAPRGTEFAVLKYLTGLPAPSRAFDVGRALIAMPERRWPRFVMHIMAAYAAGTPEHDTAAAVYALLRQEVAA